jgi:hypothetical protein
LLYLDPAEPLAKFFFIPEIDFSDFLIASLFTQGVGLALEKALARSSGILVV